MNIGSTVKHLASKGVYLSWSGEKLMCKAEDGALTQGLRQVISENRGEIITYLQEEVLQDQEISPRIPGVQIPVSYAQQRLWFIDQFEGGSSHYNMPGAFRLEGKLDRKAFRSAIEGIIDRHEVLRTRFEEIDGKAYQVIMTEYDVPITEHDLSQFDKEDQEARLSKLAAEDAGKPFNLAQDVLIRIHLLKLGETEFMVHFNMHHIASDGWSAAVLIKEFSAIYVALLKDGKHQLRPLRVQYADFACWQREQLQGEQLEKQLNFWKKQLADLPAVHELPLDQSRPIDQTYEGGEFKMTLNREVALQVKQACRTYDVTLFMFVQTVFSLLLGRYSNQTDVVMGTPVAGRRHKDIEQLIGFFVNSLVLRTDLSGNLSFEALIRKNKKDILDAFAHQNVPFEMLVEELNPARSLSYSPLFQVMISLQNNEQTEFAIPGLRVSVMPEEDQSIKFDLDLNILETDTESIELTWSFNSALFHEASIHRMADSFKVLLEGVLNNPAKDVATLPLLSEEGYEKLLDFNPKINEADRESTMVSLFEKVVNGNSDRTSVVFENDEITYGQLNERSNQLAYGLLERGVKPDDLIGIEISRSIDMIVAILGVLKSGAGYVPIDTNYPKERKLHILKDSGVSLVLTQNSLRIDFEGEGVEYWPIDGPDSFSQYSKDNPERIAAPNNLAYVIYTSGSTGKPKGMAVEHRNVVSITQSWTTQYKLHEFEVNLLQLASISFDVFVGDFCRSLLSGGKMIICPDDIRLEIESLYALMSAHRISIMDGTPGHLIPLMAYVSEEQLDIDFIQLLVLGSDVLDYGAYQRLLGTYGSKMRIINSYGTTETTIDSSYYEERQPEGLAYNTTPIGKSYGNTQLYVVDALGQPVPIGVEGELWIGGAGVGRGYLNRPELDAQKFMESPFEPGQRIYKTGDRAKWLPCGNLYFLGRKDDQVKIRGYRVELGEIESHLQSLPFVKDGVVLAKQDKRGDHTLVAYLVPNAQAPEIEDLKAELAKSLPSYMVPQSFQILDALPLSPNDKVDRKSLLSYSDVPREGTSYQAARNETEEILVHVFSQVLQLDQVGINDNFFELGGDSILSIQIVSRARQVGITFKVKDIFEHQSIAALAKVVKRTNAAVLAEQGRVQGNAMLSPIQTWFFEESFEKSSHWNQAVLLSCGKDMEPAVLEKAWQAVVEHHDALTLQYKVDTNGVEQYRSDTSDVALEIIDLSNEPDSLVAGAITHVCQEVQASLSLESGPVAKAVWIETPKDEKANRLFICIHHLVVDGVSWRILLEDLQKSFESIVSNESVKLPPKTSSFKQYANRIGAYAAQESLQDEINYWQTIAQKDIKALPLDFPNGQNLEEYSQTLKVSLGEEQTIRLLRDANQAYSTRINDLLLAALTLALNKWTEQSDFRIMLEGHGREDFDEQLDLTRTVGWFTTLFPVLLTTGDGSVASVIKSTKETLRTLPENGLGYGVLRYLHQDEEVRRRLTPSLSDQVVFNYLGQLDNVLSDSKGFGKAEESAGYGHGKLNHRTSELDVNALISENELIISMSFSSLRYSDSTITPILDEFRESLIDIIEHCANMDIQGYTPSDFPLAKLNQSGLDNLVADAASPNGIEAIYPLTPVQEGMLFHSLFDNEGSAYIEQLHCEFAGEIDIEVFKETWKQIIQSHSVLRTSFVHLDLSRPLQIVNKQVSLPIEVIDWSDLEAGQAQRQFHELCKTERATKFEFEKAPLVRLKLVQFSKSHFGFIWTDHHILVDGWSMSILFQELFSCYDALCQQKVVELSEDRFGDHIEFLESSDETEKKEFWSSYLSGFQSPTALPFNIRADKVSATEDRFEELELELRDTIETGIESFVKKHKITHSLLVQGAWALLLGAYSRNDDVLFGATVSGRPAELENVEDRVGLFINTLPIRARIDYTVSPVVWLKDLQKGQIDLRENQYNALTDIHNWSDVPNGESLFETIVVFSNYPVSELGQTEVKRLQLENIQFHGKNNYPLTLAATASGRLKVKFIFNAELYTNDQIENIGSCLREVLGTLVSQPDLPMTEMQLASTDEQSQFAAWQGRPSTDRRLYPLPTYIEQQVAKTPESIAVRFKNDEMSYADLNLKANRLAGYLEEQEIESGECVGIYMERGFELMVSLLAVMKSGATYLPLDPNHKGERLNAMIQDAGAELVLVQSQLVDDLPLAAIDIMVLDQSMMEGDWLSEYDDAEVVQSGSNAKLDDTAYMIYTSGSTGKPKGVEVSHASLMDYCAFGAQHYYETDLSGSLVATSHGFDLTIPCLYLPLLSGGCVELVPWGEELSALVDLCAAVDGRNYLLRLTPVHLEGLLALLPNDSELPQKHVFVIGGSQLYRKLANTLQRRFPNTIIYNHYGPTETVVGCSIHRFTDNGEIDAYNSEVVPIGRPMDNTQLHVLNGHGKPCPIGMAGELFIGGACVAKGYHNQPELTAEKFVKNPLGRGDKNRLYRTGDLVRWTASGYLEYVGRADDQVKIRGHRVEPGEIEHQLLEITNVKEAAVVTRKEEAGDTSLLAFITVEDSHIDIKTVRKELAKHLPEYMVPQSITVLEAFPLTINRKVDRRALEKLDTTDSGTLEYVAPRNEQETVLAKIFGDVLGIDKVGAHDNFFELGGHSLKATQLVSAIRQSLGRELPLRALFENPTVASISEVLNNAVVNLAIPDVLPVADHQEIGLSYAQQRLWIIDQLEGGSAHYHMPGAFKLEGNLNTKALEKALETIIDRHEILRTTFAEGENGAIQVVNPDEKLPMDVVDLKNRSAAEQGEEIKRLASVHALNAFDLAKGPLIRLQVLLLSEQENIVLFNMHHIVSDGWSRSLLIDEFSALYAAFASDLPNPLSPLRIQYGDYAEWQRQWLQGDLLDQHLSYWVDRLQGIPPVHNLPLDHARPERQNFDSDTVSFVIEKERTDKINAFCRENDVTLFIFLQTALAVLIGRYSNEEDIVIGTPVAGRNHKDIEGLIGLFINTVVLRTNLSNDPSFLDLLKNNRKAILDDFTYQQMPYEMLVDELKPERNLSYNPICQVKFVVQNYERNDIELPDITLTPLKTEQGKVRFDLDLTVVEREGVLNLYWSYKSELFEASTVQRMGESFLTLLDGILNLASQPILELPMAASVGRPETSMLKGELDAAGRSECLHTYFEEQARKSPNSNAVQFGERSMSFSQLNEKANRLAHALADQEIGKGDFVGIYQERTPALIVCLLAVMKSGATYVPLDPRQKDQRLQYMISDAGIELVLVQEDLVSDLPLNEIDIFVLDEAIFDDHWLSEYDGLNPSETGVEVALSDSVYVIYTSGSTGTPKGVEVSHAGLIDYCAFGLSHYLEPHLGGSLVITSHAFDITIPALYLPLLAGTSVHLLPWGDELDAAAKVLGNTEGHGYLLRMTPMHIQAILDLMPAETTRTQSHVFVVGGAQLTKELAERIYRSFPNSTLYNHYGPTETVVGCCIYEVPKSPIGSRSIPIGEPMDNTSLFILNSSLQPVPMGVAGELVVAGPCVAKGYLNQPGLTAERFVQLPSENSSQRAYRTGDLVRELASGNLEFVGRTDDQIKINGYRVEPGEIVHCLLQHPEISAAVVLAMPGKNEDPELTAFFISNDSELRNTEIKGFLEKQLPAYMIPSRFVVLESIPLNKNGKVDQRALAKIEGGELGANTEFVAPQTPAEIQLSEIWKGVLGIDEIGIHDNFFEIGGQSLRATQVISRVRKEMNLDMGIRDMFENPTISQLTQLVDSSEKLDLTGIEPIPNQDKYPLSNAQKRLWIIDQLEVGSAHYNMPGGFKVNGALNIEAFKKTLSTIVERHSVLRTQFIFENGEAYQVVNHTPELPLTIVDLTKIGDEDQVNQVQRLANEDAKCPFDLKNDLMIRFHLLELSQQNHVVLFNMHHIVSDGWSKNLLIDEFSKIYTAFSEGKSNPLPPLRIQYHDYANWQKQGTQLAVLERQLAYWKTQLFGLPVVHHLPLDSPRPSVQSHESGSYRMPFNKETTKRIQDYCGTQRATTFMFLQTAFSVLISRCSNETDVVIGTPVAGRDHPDIEGLIGFFVNTLVLRAEVDGSQSFEELLAANRQTIIDAFTHQNLPYEVLVDELNPQRNLGYNPLCQVQFSLQNYEKGEIDLPGLEIVPLEGGKPKVRFDLDLTAAETDDGFQLHWTYKTDLFNASTIERMARSYQLLVEAILAQTANQIGKINLLNDGEIATLESWHGEARLGNRKEGFLVLFEQQVLENPENIACSFGEQQLSYKELNAKAKWLANYLINTGVGPGQYVGICQERSNALVVSMLAVLKSGGAYVPLDPKQPNSRLQYFIQDTGMTCLLAQPHLVEGLALDGVDIVGIDDSLFADNWLSEYSEQDQLVSVSLNETAYVIYTSGSTGQPKGVEISHSALIDYLASSFEYYYPKAATGSMVVSSFAFDHTVPLIYLPLMAGQTVMLMPNEEEFSTMARLVGNLKGEEHFLLRATPALVPILLDMIPGNDPLPQPHVFVIGGDRFPGDAVPRLQKRFPNATIYNHYGPTETTVGSTMYQITENDQNIVRGDVPIGQPMYNTKAYVLDEYLMRVPTGVIGQLYLGGPCLAKGYLNQPELTLEKFIQSPFDNIDQLYVTGDLVRWLSDGSLEFIGRADDQIKINGHRVELGEVSHVLAESPGVKEAVALTVANSQGQYELMAYIVPKEGAFIDIVSLKDHLGDRLPVYMIPTGYVTLEQLPKTRNGKLDRRQLEQLRADDVSEGEEHVEPNTTQEKVLHKVWKTVLNRDSISVLENFFLAGGGSIKALQLVAQLPASGYDLPVKAIFEYPVLRELATKLRPIGEAKNGKNPHSLSSAVALQPLGDKTPLFVVSGIGGDISCFHPLVNALDDSRPVYGLTPSGMLDIGEPILSEIEEIAAHYVQQMKRIHSKGPYQLLGYSFGGSVVYEIARQLEVQHEEVSSVVVIDHIAPVDNKKRQKLEEPEQNWEAFRILVQSFNRDLPYSKSAFLALSEKQHMDAFQEVLKQNGIEVSQDQIKRRIQIRMAQAEINFTADTKLKSPKIMVLRSADGNLSKTPETLETGWSQLSLQQPSFVELPGDHVSILDTKNARQLALTINEHLKNSENKQAALETNKITP